MKLASIVAAALLLAGSAVQAANISAPVETLVVEADSNTSVSFGHTFLTAAKGDTFANRYDFTLPASAYIQATVTSSSLDLTGFSIFDSATNKSVFDGVETVRNKTDKWLLTVDQLDAGSYYFLVSGTIISATGASLAGNGVLEVSALPVPEPAAPLMLLGGLAVLAAAARRKVK